MMTLGSTTDASTVSRRRFDWRFDDRRFEPLDPLCPTCRVRSGGAVRAESTMAESTRTFLTPDRLKSAIEVMPLRSPRHRRARAGRRARRQSLPPTHAVDHGITNGTVFAAGRRRVYG